LTWSDVVVRSTGHPRRNASRARVSAAVAAVDSAGAIPNPTLEIAVGRGYARSGDEARTEWEAAVEVPLSWAVQRGPRMEAAEHVVSATRQDARGASIEVLLGLNELFWQVAHDQELMLALNALVAETAAIADGIGRRVEKGEARPIERLKIEVEREAILGDADVARILLDSRTTQLATWLGLQGAHVAVTAEFESVPKVPDLRALRTLARASHPEIRAAEARVRAGSAELDAQRRERIPAMSVRGFTQHELDRRAFGAGITVDVPLWSWNGSGVAMARAALTVAQRELELAGRELDSRITAKHGTCAAAAALAKVYRDRLLPAAARSAAATVTSYRLGELGLLEVIDSRRVLINTRKDSLAVLARAHTECQQLGILTATEVSR
jgi:cobalt-zinc-cadmium efflux system outer membrane protein